MDEEPKKDLPIRRIVRSKETGLFLGHGSVWVEQAQDAAHWGSIAEVVGVCLKHNIKNSELVLQFGNERFNVVLDIDTPA
ncbi:MAG: hypothetical protein JWR69_2213 [Pedosphaera sp.]|nr:hypothetical protein [Pedosphaera sp.]